MHGLPRAVTKVVVPEDLIGLKLQALANSPDRDQDRLDIKELLRLHRSRMDMTRVRDYFKIFGKEAELDALVDDLA